MQSNSTLAFLWRKSLRALLLFCCFCSLQTLHAQLISFPGAEGAGRFTSGGRGTATTFTTVFEVTNLNDDNLPGSLRYALQASSSTYPYKTIVFRVSGTIHLASPLAIKSNVTIAGQTAPGGGICIADYPVSISGDNIIVRYIRFRLGDKNQQASNGNDDAFGGTGHKNIIIDHCTMSWSDDEAFTVYGGDSTTLQWNMISEPLNYSYHDEGTGIQNHGYGGIQGGKKTSIHHNLFAHCYSRVPRFDGVRNLSPNTPGLENVDFVNNVLYNWGSNNVYGGEGGNYNLINNYYKYGPSTSSSSKYRVVNPYKQTTAPVIPYGQYYLSGNYVDGSTANTNNNWLGVVMEGGTLADTTQAKVTTPFSIAPITTQSAASAYNLVLQNAGAILPIRDTLDQRIVNDVKNRTGKIIDVQGGYPHGTAYAATVNAWPGLVSTTAPTDSDHDGMPDVYETANGLNPNDASDRGAIAANGYTNLENYLNSLTTVASLTVNGNVTGLSQTIGSPSNASSYSVTGTNLTGNVVVTAPANFQVSLDGSTWSSSVSITPVSGSVSATVYVRLNATAAGSYSGNISNVSSGTTQTIAVDGTAVTMPAGINAVVAQDGSGNYTTLTAAINAAPTNSLTPWVIFVKNGKYREKITIPSNKRAIQLIGESVANTFVYYDDPATVLGTQNSASFTVSANSFVAQNITFANTYGDGSQAVALLINADSAVLKNCRLMGNQDTYYNKGSGTAKQYLKNCYIDGNIDFIFGSAVVVFDSCVIYPKSRTTSGSSYITAPNTASTQTYGYVFRNCTIANNTGATAYYLSRPWQNTGGATTFNNKAVFLNTTMGSDILPAGWSTWDATTNTALTYYGEYNSKDFTGAPVDVSQRVSWSNQLNSTQAATYTNATIFGGWDPCTAATNICSGQGRDIAVSNFRATKNTSNASLDWNISWAMPGIKYELYRSATKNGGYSKIYETTSVNDTAYNFNYADVLPIPGNAFYYYVVASKSGLASNTTDTVSISSVQTIVVSGTPSAFSQNLGTPSAAQTITVSGSNLSDDIIVTPPANYEVSTNGTNWYNSSNPLVLTQTNTTVAATNVSVRLNSPSLGSSSGNIVVSSNGATSVNVPVTGTTAIIPPVTEIVLQDWPMTQNNQDSAGVRSIAVTPSTSTLNKLYVSNGTTVPAIPAYSATYGQALGATVAGDGYWTSNAPYNGPGGNLNRTFYEQFTVTAKAGYSVRVDSLLVTSAFYATSSSTKLGVVYSKNGFTSPADSTDISTSPGSFTNPILLAQQNAGPSNQYLLAFKGTTGVTLNPGETLTFRLYFSCSSTGSGRYGMLKDVIVKGTMTDLSVTPPGMTTSGSLTTFNQTLGLPSAPQTYTVSGSNLTTQLYVVAPTNYELSLDNVTWNNSNTPIVLTPTNGSVANTTIYVRLNAAATGTYSGNIQHITGGATTINLAVNGTTSATPTLVTSGALGLFSQTIGTPSATQTYNVTGLNLTGNVTITPPANFEISSDGGLTWYTSSNPLSLTPAGNNFTSTITVRLNAAASGTYSGNIIHASAGAANVSVAVSGITVGAPTVLASGTLTPFTQTIGTPSAVQTYTISGSALTGNITIMPPANYEVSDNGTTWYTNANPLVLTQSSGSVVNTTISVRLNASTPGTYAGDIINASQGATSVNIAVSGTAVPAPVLTVTGTLNNFSQTIGTPTAVQTYTLAGANLVSNVTVTPPANYEVSINGTNWFTASNPLVLTPTAGTLNTTTISVRLNATAAGTYAGNITNVTSGTATANVAVNGTAVLPPTITTSVSTIAAFTQTIGAPTAGKKYTVSGANLTANITVTPPAGFEISKDSVSWSSAPIVLTQTNGTVAATTIFVRMNATLAGNYSGNIINASTGATTKNVAVSGNAPGLSVTAPSRVQFVQYIPSPSAVQTYVLSGNYLSGNVTITPPAKYQVSVDTGKTWSWVPVTVAPTNGSVNVMVSVRLFSSFAGVYNGTIVNSTPGSNPYNFDVNGIAVVSSSYTIYPVPAYYMIYFTHPVSSSDATITIYNMGGQKVGVLPAKINAVETPINISGIPGGVYIAVYENGATKATLRFIKQ